MRTEERSDISFLADPFKHIFTMENDSWKELSRMKEPYEFCQYVFFAFPFSSIPIFPKLLHELLII